MYLCPQQLCQPLMTSALTIRIMQFSGSKKIVPRTLSVVSPKLQHWHVRSGQLQQSVQTYKVPPGILLRKAVSLSGELLEVKTKGWRVVSVMENRSERWCGRGSKVTLCSTRPRFYCPCVLCTWRMEASREPHTLHSLRALIQNLHLELGRQLSWQSACHTQVKTQVWSPEPKQKSQAWCHVCNLDATEAERNSSLPGACCPVSLTHLASSSRVRQPVSNSKVGGSWKFILEADLWLLHVFLHVHVPTTCPGIYTCICTHMNMYIYGHRHVCIHLCIHTHTNLLLGSPLSLGLVLVWLTESVSSWCKKFWKLCMSTVVPVSSIIRLGWL